MSLTQYIRLYFSGRQGWVRSRAQLRLSGRSGLLVPETPRDSCRPGGGSGRVCWLWRCSRKALGDLSVAEIRGMYPTGVFRGCAHYPARADQHDSGLCGHCPGRRRQVPARFTGQPHAATKGLGPRLASHRPGTGRSAAGHNPWPGIWSPRVTGRLAPACIWRSAGYARATWQRRPTAMVRAAILEPPSSGWPAPRDRAGGHRRPVPRPAHGALPGPGLRAWCCH